MNLPMLDSSLLGLYTYVDIETATQFPNFEALKAANPTMARVWSQKFSSKNPRTEDPDFGYSSNAMLYPEYSRIVCITASSYNFSTQQFEFKNFHAASYEECFNLSYERIVLQEFQQYLTQTPQPVKFLGYRIKGFDIPFLYRRCLVHGLEPHPSLLIWNKKPWELPHLDLYEVWQNGPGAISGYTSFELLCNILGVSDPKSDIHGGEVHEVFWQQQDINRIVDYCQRDVLACIQLAYRLSNYQLQ